jgi:hypothetical protein
MGVFRVGGGHTSSRVVADLAIFWVARRQEVERLGRIIIMGLPIDGMVQKRLEIGHSSWTRPVVNVIIESYRFRTPLAVFASDPLPRIDSHRNPDNYAGTSIGATG